MALAIMFVGAPLAVYLFLVAVPSGRGSNVLIGAIGLIIAYIWVGYLLSLEPLWTGNDRADAYTFAAAVIMTFAFVAGSITAVFGRRMAARYASLSYPAVVILILPIIIVPLFLVVGL